MQKAFLPQKAKFYKLNLSIINEIIVKAKKQIKYDILSSESKNALFC